MGDPRRRNPVVSSTGRGGPLVFILLGFVEYCLIVLAMEVASKGLRVAMAGSGECPEVDVRILVFMGLTKQPNGAPMQLKLSHKNWRSSRGTQAETSSTYPRRWVMPPFPSSPIWLARRRALARSLRRASRGCRRRATTSEAKMGEVGSLGSPLLPLGGCAMFRRPICDGRFQRGHRKVMLKGEFQGRIP